MAAGPDEAFDKSGKPESSCGASCADALPHNRGMALHSRDLEALADGLHRLSHDGGRPLLIKRRRDAPAGFFAAEAHGLDLLAVAGGLRIPEVFDVAQGWLVLEDLASGPPAPGAWTRAGAALAHQHACSGASFGLDRDGWCGDSPQANAPVDVSTDEEGHAFFAQRRLLPQVRRARDAGWLEARDTAVVERLCARLPDLVPRQPSALLHGDLWRGNLHVCGDGELALIDAGAVHYGWAEAELAMLTLFGAPPPALFQAYESVADIAPDWRDRAPLYNLYHLLNHLNLFGGGYLAQVRAVLRRYG